jgi:glutamate-1-semialdehyde 2,1-aminomutase
MIAPRAHPLDAGLDRLRADYADRRPRSHELHERARCVLPGGNTRTQVFFRPFPFYVSSAEGCWLEDVDGLRYRDLVNNYTSLIHGHAHPEVVEAIAAQAARGTALGAPSPQEVLLAEELTARVPSLDQVRFTNSGSEAVLAAVKTARIATERDLIVKLEGSYHGGAESVQLSVASMGALGEVVAEPGVPLPLTVTTRVLPVDDPELALTTLREIGPRAAALIVEPMLGGTTMVPLPRDLLASLMTIARERDMLVIFDEVLSFRLGYGGLQGEYGLVPDLTALGKIIGGGLPVGAFGGRRDLMEVWDPRQPTPRYAAGTFNANPLTMAAGLAAIRALTSSSIDRINRAGDRLRAAFNGHARRRGVPLVASGYGSILQIHEGEQAPASHRQRARRDRRLVEATFLRLLGLGVFVTPRGTANVSTALTESDVLAVEEALAAALDEGAAMIGEQT